MSQYRAYPAYKDSGVEWIGLVPEHWKVAPVKYHYDARLGKMIQPAAVSDRDIEVPYHRAQTVQWERIVESDIKEMWASPRDIEQFSVSEGDLLICEGGDVCRAAIVKQPPEKNMIFQNSIHRIRSKGEYGVGWVMRLMQHLRSSEWIDVLCNKNTIVHFTSDKLGSLECPLPPPDEQASIAAALDRETARIDALVEKKTRFIELLKEKRQALITHAVTKGLDPNVKMKDSGVEWIGQVPEHWAIPALKFLLSTPITDGPHETPVPAEPQDGIVFISAEAVSSGRINFSKAWGYISRADHKRYSRKYKPQQGDIYMVKSGATTGITAMVEDNREFNIWSPLAAIRANSETAPKFLLYALRSTEFQAGVALNWSYGTQQNIGMNVLENLPLPIPPYKEQATIAATLERETARIDALIGKAEQSITLLKERRSAFITAAVTGQIDLRGKQ